MDEEIDDERRRTMIDKYTAGFVRSAKATCSLDLPKRLRHEVTSRYAIREDADIILEDQSKGRPPFIREKPSTTAIVEGESVTLNCYVTGDPEPVIQWFRNDLILGETTRVFIETSKGRSTLTIRECKNFDEGLYKVVARNSLGQVVHKFRIIKADIPGPCDPPEAEQLSSHQVLMKWRTPRDDGGAPILAYYLQMRHRGDNEWLRLSDNVHQEFYLVEELTPNSLYQFRVAAKNFKGWGEFSVSTPAIKTTDRGTPKISMPIDQHISQKSEKKLTVLQLPGARGEMRDLLDYSREIQPVPQKTGDMAELQIRKYRMVEELGRGRFSVVMKCLRQDDQRLFACKILQRKNREEAVKQEYDITKSLRHERLATLYEVYTINNATAFIMEYLAGPNILNFLCSRIEYNEQMVSKVINQVLDGLSYLHWRGYCHLDIQPSNVMLTSPRTGDVKLIDFGGAQPVSRSGSQVKVAGLVDYIAPEILSDGKAYHHSDVWSIGVLSYVLLTGVSPFLAEDEEETKTNIQYVRYKYEVLGNTVSPEATRFLMLIFKRDPSKRPTDDDCREHKWLQESDYLVHKRERAVIPSFSLREYSSKYHKKLAQEVTRSSELVTQLNC